jgi:hypothetical protein
MIGHASTHCNHTGRHHKVPTGLYRRALKRRSLFNKSNSTIWQPGLQSTAQHICVQLVSDGLVATGERFARKKTTVATCTPDASYHRSQGTRRKECCYVVRSAITDHCTARSRNPHAERPAMWARGRVFSMYKWVCQAGESNNILFRGACEKRDCQTLNGVGVDLDKLAVRLHLAIGTLFVRNPIVFCIRLDR